MAIINWPKQDRPREKLLAQGVQALTDAELLAICINTGRHGCSALGIAREFLRIHGSLKHFLDAPRQDLLQTPGFGLGKYAMVKAAIELGLRYHTQEPALACSLNDAQVAITFVSGRLQHHQREVFACVFLNAKQRILAFEELFYGTINEASIYPREVVKRGLHHNAANAIIAHNHPSGDPNPSDADIDITQILQQALALVDITLIDHIIVGQKRGFSFAEAGLI